jgi:hypothetical protein
MSADREALTAKQTLHSAGAPYSHHQITLPAARRSAPGESGFALIHVQALDDDWVHENTSCTAVRIVMPSPVAAQLAVRCRGPTGADRRVRRAGHK